MATQIIRYVDPDASGAANGTSWTDAYTSLSVWESTEQKDLQAANEQHTVYCRSSSGTQDTTAIAINGWNMDATHYVEVIGNDFPSDGVYDGTKYVLHNDDDGDYALYIVDEYVRIHNLQILVTASGGTRIGIQIAAIGTSDIRIDSCIVKGVCSGTGIAEGILVNDLDATVTIYNTLVYDFISGADTQFRGIFCNDVSALQIHNCTIYNCYTGILRNDGIIAVRNTVVGNCTDDFSGEFNTIEYCCSDDGDGTNAQNPSGGAWANEFTTPGSDFSLLSIGNCAGNGTDDPNSGLYLDDIIGTTRTSVWDIGAFEFISDWDAILTVSSSDLSPIFNTLSLTNVVAEGSDVDKFLVDSLGAVKYRTGAEVLSDIDGQTQGDVLDDLNTLGAASSDGEMIVATGAGAFAYESGATLRTSIGVGTGDSPTFTGLTLSGLTQGSILFTGASGVVSEDNSDLFWDNSNKRLGIGTATPSQQIEIQTVGAALLLMNGVDPSARAILQFEKGGVLKWDFGTTFIGSDDFHIRENGTAARFSISSTAHTLTAPSETDLTLNFAGTTNSGVLTWMEDEDYFVFADAVRVDSTLRVADDLTIIKSGQVGLIMNNGSVQWYLYQPSGSGDLRLDISGDKYIFQNDGNLRLALAGGLELGSASDALKVSDTYKQMGFNTNINTAGGHQLILGAWSAQTRDYDHVPPANPTFFVHSATNPNTANDEWISFAHDQTDGVFGLGSGAYNFTHAVADTDITFNFIGTTNSGVFSWMEDEDYFKFGNDVLLDTGIIYLQETTTPTPVANHAALYTTSDNELFWQDGAGTEHLLHGDSFSNIWYHGSSTVEVTISTQNVFTIIDSFTVVGHEDDLLNAVGSSANNNITLSSIGGGEYEISYHGSATATGGADKEMMFVLGITLATPKDITNVTDNTVSPIVITSVAHGLENGDMVEIVNILGNTAANGSFIVANKAADTFEIVNLAGGATTGNGDYNEGSPTGDITILYPGNMVVHRMVRGADLGAMSATGLHILSASDILAVYVANVSGTTNLTVAAFSFDITRIGD